MKNIVLIFIAIIALTSCKEEKKESVDIRDVIQKRIEEKYISFGNKIMPKDYLSRKEILTKLKSLKKGDTIDVKFESSIKRVCKKKGCWMELDLDNNESIMVKFKDYGFFMPLNSEKREVIVLGKAYIDIVTVNQLQHYAKDEGLSKEEINKITEEEITFAVESTGVLMKE